MLASSLLVLAPLGLAACDGGGTRTDPPVPVSVELFPPQSITATVMETGAIPTQTLSGFASGELEALNGATIYVFIEDPALLVSTSSVLTDPWGAFSLTLEGRALMVPGRHTGTLKIHASLAPGGRRPLGGSPLLVPYDVTVLDPISLDTTALRVEAPFGDPLPVGTVTATVTPYVTDWSASVSTTQGCSGTGQPLVPGPSQRVGCATDGTINLHFPLRAPGTYPEALTVRAHARYNARTYTITRRVAVTRVVTASDAIDYAADPPELQIERTRGDSSFREEPYALILNTGASAVFDGVEYLTSPAAAAGHPQATAWWQALPGGTRTCDVSGAAPDCLPEGTYTARLHYLISRNGAQRDAYYPVSLLIAACSSYVPVTPGSYVDYEYRYAGGTPTTTRIQVVASTATTVTSRSTESRTPTSSYLSTWTLTDAGAYSRSSRQCAATACGVEITFTPPIVMLPRSTTPGFSETTVSTVDQITSSYQTTRVATVDGTESVTVPAGTFSALKITARVTSPAYGQDDYYVTWWVAGIGRVKMLSYPVTSSPASGFSWEMTGHGVAAIP